MDNSIDKYLAEQFGFRGRKILVTGASRGIGQALALGFARVGADLVLTARDAASLDDTAAAARDLGAAVQCLGIDQRDVGAVRAQLAGLRDVDVLINNAGIEQVCDAADIDEALWDRIVDTNLKGAFFVAQTVAAGMAVRGAGAIVNLASLTSFVGVPTAVPYSASKSGVLGMTRALAAEWAPKGIRVNAIAPGYFHTGLTDVFYEDPDWVAAMTAKVPLGRLGKLDDLIGAVLFLGGKASAYVTGQCIVIDGGYLSTI
ncbi:SDR family NAD(P)-dependent oxidoreductase [Pseudodonghicola xiamenensis]|uniref:2-deoxy-D-gluconate 3-dehydrogenase n=1 Tax=Pseudodonghicola xiamenensis TaxID=337702 RepID=A0A8J3H7B5_9RHOB|nr:SDR family oxidoreductase [Pseudodonghicola xiamenensis]GHG86244.1 2-deoxy-D-gluconate 3-dehydrogenase [Pseudodonghicola xiamenensis]